MTTPPLLSVGVPNFGSFAGGDWRRLVDLARVAEDAGCDRVVVVDHVVMGPNTGAYRWGRFPTGPDAPWLEPLAVLSAMASTTSTIRLATGILIAGLRPAALLAKQAATVDVLSDGRLELGVGIGWQREEYAALGLRWEDRGRILTDTLAACTALWRDLPATIDTATIHATDIHCVPQPVQPGGVPFLLAGTLTPRTIDRIVRYGAGWIPIMGETVDGVAAGVATLREAFDGAGRDPAALVVSAAMSMVKDADGRPDLDATIEASADLAAAGATALNLPFQAFCADLDGAPAVLERAARRFAEVHR